ncbi:uncharacterized protein N7479_009647 [Penicillium vulpinum]|uniref:uncharacterized protein n=1 Tax=Penicillium vulpinum TaxID=29845 RepID=UPI0025476C03|nr:uncharacterized protein N7479_009647 [Penicillium vulpinum]KAJ5951234.1 hypothetical protein N7479_009647 [Penicillium vulpinum]
MFSFSLLGSKRLGQLVFQLQSERGYQTPSIPQGVKAQMESNQSNANINFFKHLRQEFSRTFLSLYAFALCDWLRHLCGRDLHSCPPIVDSSRLKTEEISPALFARLTISPNFIPPILVVSRIVTFSYPPLPSALFIGHLGLTLTTVTESQ